MAGIFIILLFSFFAFGIGIVLYLLQAIGLYKMGEKLQVSNAWLSFIPVANIYALGKIAEKHIKADGRKSAKFSKILLILYIALIVILIAFIVFAFAFFMVELTSNPTLNAYIEGEQFAATAVYTVILPIIIGYLGIISLSVALAVVQYVALWRVFAIFDRGNATMYLVLSIFFSFLLPIFLFIIRNNQPQIFKPQENIM